MAYSRYNEDWQDFPSTATPIDAAALEHIEDGIVDVDERVTTLEGAAPGTPDHGTLPGLGDDDHTQYALADGSRGSFATTAQGGLADTAVQPADLGDLAVKDLVVVPGDLDATGTPSATTYLRGDGSWGTPSGGSSPSADELAYWNVKAALLDPAALAPHYYDTFDVTLTNPLWVVNAWQCQIDARSNNRFDVRVPPILDMMPLVLPTGTRIQGTGTASSLFGIDPTLVSYADPKAKFFERMGRLGSLVRRPANQNGAAAVNAWIDDTRPQFRTSDARSNTSLFMTVGGTGFGSSQQFSVPVQINSAATVDVSVFVQRVTGNSGDLKIDIRTDSAGNPSGTIIGTATVLAANLPALDAGGSWVDATITLTANLLADTTYHLQLLNDSGSTEVCQWRAAEGVSQTYYKGRYHNGTSWVDPTGFKHFCCAINRDTMIDYLITHAMGFDTPWAITLGELTGANINLWTEINDTTPTQRTGAGIAVPYSLRFGMRYRMNGGISASRASWIALELPSDW